MTPVARFDSMRTSRLLMRRWRDSDREPFAALNADQHTMRFFPATLDQAASDALIDRLEERFESQGFGLWALEIAQTGQFIGFTGLNPLPDDVPGTGGVTGCCVVSALKRSRVPGGARQGQLPSMSAYRSVCFIECQTDSIACLHQARKLSGEAGLVVVKLAYRFALNPTPAQERALRSHAGAARFAWNWGLHQCKQRYAAERKWYSAAELHQRWNAEKKADPALGWWAENSKCCYQEAFRNLDRALRDFVKSRKGQRKGRKLGFPRYKKRRKAKDSFRLTGAIRCQGSTVTLPRLGTIATCEPTTKLARRVAADTARILSATVSRTAQRWYVSFTVEEDRAIPARHARPGTAVGIDLGIKTLITGVDDAGTVITVPGPRPLKAALRRLRRASRAHSRKQLGSGRRRRSAARLARLHARVASVRADALHQATSMLASRYETVVAEDLNVAGMTRNRRLARAVGDQGFGALRRMLTYKSAWRGGQLVTADRFFPSSKKCSGCGAVKAKLPLAERTYRCERCGLVIDRDVNAARNLLSLAASGAESLNACGAAVRPGPAGHAALKQEPGTPPGGKTGTAAPQGTAAA